jgi:hypothetical protein
LPLNIINALPARPAGYASAVLFRAAAAMATIGVALAGCGGDDGETSNSSQGADQQPANTLAQLSHKCRYRTPQEVPDNNTECTADAVKFSLVREGDPLELRQLDATVTDARIEATLDGGQTRSSDGAYAIVEVSIENRADSPKRFAGAAEGPAQAALIGQTGEGFPRGGGSECGEIPAGAKATCELSFGLPGVAPDEEERGLNLVIGDFGVDLSTEVPEGLPGGSVGLVALGTIPGVR